VENRIPLATAASDHHRVLDVSVDGVPLFFLSLSLSCSARRFFSAGVQRNTVRLSLLYIVRVAAERVRFGERTFTTYPRRSWRSRRVR
jgi:hypothetical protein